jgi:hypothetical protein
LRSLAARSSGLSGSQPAASASRRLYAQWLHTRGGVPEHGLSSSFKFNAPGAFRANQLGGRSTSNWAGINILLLLLVVVCCSLL